MTTLRESQTLPLFTSCLFRLFHDTVHASIASALGHRKAMTLLQVVRNLARPT